MSVQIGEVVSARCFEKSHPKNLGKMKWKILSSKFLLLPMLEAEAENKRRGSTKGQRAEIEPGQERQSGWHVT